MVTDMGCQWQRSGTGSTGEVGAVAASRALGMGVAARAAGKCV